MPPTRHAPAIFNIQNPTGSTFMLDVILILVGCACFGVAIAYAYACDRL